MITLASGSWLRKTILESSEFLFQIKTKETDERAIEALHNDKSDKELAIILASAKAEDVLKDNPGDLVIAADTFAVMPSGERLHKPVSSEDAIVKSPLFRAPCLRPLLVRSSCIHSSV
jgi:predicted house-cleaning NTP pyrophosphatase (Maf/HAM1 superfamily)